MRFDLNVTPTHSVQYMHFGSTSAVNFKYEPSRFRHAQSQGLDLEHNIWEGQSQILSTCGRIRVIKREAVFHADKLTDAVKGDE